MRNADADLWLAPPPRLNLQPGEPPRFSVVIRAYQAAASIGAAIASALAQTRPAHEVIVVDDGSTDDLARALSEFRHQITLIRQDNSGAASAANTGLASASGDFLALLDADDVFGPSRLEALGDLAAARPDLDLLSAETELVLNGRVVGHFHTATPFVVSQQRTGILEKLLRRLHPGCPHLASAQDRWLRRDDARCVRLGLLASAHPRRRLRRIRERASPPVPASARQHHREQVPGVVGSSSRPREGSRESGPSRR